MISLHPHESVARNAADFAAELLKVGRPAGGWRDEDRLPEKYLAWRAWVYAMRAEVGITAPEDGISTYSEVLRLLKQGVREGQILAAMQMIGGSHDYPSG